MKMLCALDNSLPAQTALAEALRIAKRDGAELHILSVAPSLGAVEDVPPAFVEKMREVNERVVEKAREAAAGQG
jgi:nucleotide-binding universal stress UspA family protein